MINYYSELNEISWAKINTSPGKNAQFTLQVTGFQEVELEVGGCLADLLLETEISVLRLRKPAISRLLFSLLCSDKL